MNIKGWESNQYYYHRREGLNAWETGNVKHIPKDTIRVFGKRKASPKEQLKHLSIIANQIKESGREVRIRHTVDE